MSVHSGAPLKRGPTPEANFVVYEAGSGSRAYLVASTSGVRQGEEELADKKRFHPSSVAALAEAMLARRSNSDEPVEMTIKVHGFNTRRGDFEKEVLLDAIDAPAPETFRPDDRFFVGFYWQSEGLLGRRVLGDTFWAAFFTPAIGTMLLVVPAVALLLMRFGGHLHLGGVWAEVPPFVRSVFDELFVPYRRVALAALLLGTGVVLLALRLATYALDRYRALHYGVPDLGEFMRCLENELHDKRIKVELDIVAHSMGTLVVINALRVMSDFFSSKTTPGDELGRDGTYKLRSLVLCAPDLPAIMATPDRNNYFLAALRRVKKLHLFSNDRDIILKWLSSIANWMSEPRQEMSGRKLGNVLLVRCRPSDIGDEDSRKDWKLWPMTRPVFRNFHVYDKDPIVSHDGFTRADLTTRPLHFHDCTLDPSVSGDLTHHIVVLAALALAWLGLRWAPHVAAMHWVSHLAALRWITGLVVAFLALGIPARLLWPRLRDVGLLGSLCGVFADWPALAVFVSGHGWNPHSGYFALGRPPRQRIAAILANHEAFPKMDGARPVLEDDTALIRYKLLDMTV